MNTRTEMQVGTVVDHRYRVVRKIGQGGFAEVYEAQHITLERPAALKVLDIAQADRDDTYIRRFQQEAKIAANFEHPNVVRIFDFGVVQQTQRPYIAMELLTGWDLDIELRRNGPMHPHRAQKLFLGCLDALAQAHARGIVHKDLKPANLFLQNPMTDHEKLVIMDFGIARLEGDPQLTKTGAFAGTPAYLAPEYIESQIVSPAFDVYQMGLIFLETLAGQPAIRADSFMAYMIKHMQGQHEIPEGVRTSTLGPPLLKAIAIDPAKRFPTAREFMEAIRKIEIAHSQTETLTFAPEFSTSGTDKMPSVGATSYNVVPVVNTEDAMMAPPTEPDSRAPLTSSTGRHEQAIEPTQTMRPRRAHPKRKRSALPVVLYLIVFTGLAMFAMFVFLVFIGLLVDAPIDAPPPADAPHYMHE